MLYLPLLSLSVVKFLKYMYTHISSLNCQRKTHLKCSLTLLMLSAPIFAFTTDYKCNLILHANSIDQNQTAQYVESVFHSFIKHSDGKVILNESYLYFTIFIGQKLLKNLVDCDLHDMIILKSTKFKHIRMKIVGTVIQKINNIIFNLQKDIQNYELSRN